MIYCSKDMAEVKGASTVRDNLYTCLRGTALAWYTFNSNDDQKRLTKLGNGVEEWARILLKRFRESPGVALATVIKERYTMEDARSRREPIEFAQVITRAARSAEMSVSNPSTAHCFIREIFRRGLKGIMSLIWKLKEFVMVVNSFAMMGSWDSDGMV